MGPLARLLLGHFHRPVSAGVPARPTDHFQGSPRAPAVSRVRPGGNSPHPTSLPLEGGLRHPVAVPDEPKHDDAADRMAVEQVRGEALPQTWPNGAWPAGTRVRVIQDSAWKGPWAQDFLGRVSAMAAPEFVQHEVALPGELAYWVEFDEQQLDADGDGPYRKALIWGRYLERVSADRT